MIKYTYQEAEMLAQMLHSEGHIATSGRNAKTYPGLLRDTIKEPLLGCYVYPIWYYILLEETQFRGRIRGDLRRIIYKATRICCMPLREIPLKLFGENRIGLYGIILRWRLEIGK